MSHIVWKNDKLYILDQKMLPLKEKFIECNNYNEVALCIKKMNVRGAPAIGITAGYGLVLGGLKLSGDKKNFLERLTIIGQRLKDTRPTAVNLAWAVDRILGRLYDSEASSLKELKKLIEKEAVRIHKEDISNNYSIGENGAKLFPKPVNILTHCNAGALATGGYGTAVGVIRSLHKHNKIKRVFASETRPFLQGARLTSWELKKEKIPFALICDNMAGYFMQKGEIDAVIVGADRIALNGDTANKIGTYSLAVLAWHHGIPFYIAAPISTIDFKINDGSKITIEWRDEKEVACIGKKRIAPYSIKAFHPAFDVTPNKYISAIITEEKVLYPPFEKTIPNLEKLYGHVPNSSN